MIAADFPLLKEIPDSPAGAQAKWYLTRMLEKGEGASIADKQHYTPEVARRFTEYESDEKERVEWAAFAARMGEILKLELEAHSDFGLVARIETAKNQRWRFKLEVEPKGKGTLVKVTHSKIPRGARWFDLYAGAVWGWTYFMMNLKSVLETGHDLRSKHDG